MRSTSLDRPVSRSTALMFRFNSWTAPAFMSAPLEGSLRVSAEFYVSPRPLSWTIQPPTCRILRPHQLEGAHDQGNAVDDQQRSDQPQHPGARQRVVQVIAEL